METDSFAPRPQPLHGRVDVPGSKSISNRALVCAALASGVSKLVGLAGGDDTLRMIDGLRRLGVRIDGDATAPTASVSITGPVDRTRRGSVEIDAGLAGTTSRFLTAVAALCTGRTTITGGAGLRARPMAELHRILREIGAGVHSERDGFLPVTVEGIGPIVNVPGHPNDGIGLPDVHVRGDVSSQFISAVMMIAPLLGGLRLHLDGPVVSRGYLDMTAHTMGEFGAMVELGVERIDVRGTPYEPSSFEVDADWSSASYPFAAAAIAGGTVTVPRLRRNGLQPEEAFVEVLERMGCIVSIDAAGVTISRARHTPLVGIDADMSAMSDLVPTLAAIAACADGPSRITGVGFIRGKESDRLGDLAGEINACGGRVEVLEDGLAIEPAPLRAATVNAHDDHRLAMSLALLGLRRDGIGVAEPAVVGKSWPSYWSDMRSGLGLDGR